MVPWTAAVFAGGAPHLTITAAKGDNKVVVSGPGLTVTMPYADDYVLGDATADRPLMLQSKNLKVVASVTVDAEPDARPPLEYLQAQLAALKAKVEVVKPALTRQGKTPVLVYWVPIEGAVQFNLWVVRPGPAGHMHRLHVSQLVSSPPEAKAFATSLMSLVDGGFVVGQ